MSNSSTPWDEGFKRAIWAALTTFLVTFAFTFFVQFQLALADDTISDTDKLRNALIAAAISALAPLATGARNAKADQTRADKGIVLPSDVPVAIEAKWYEKNPVLGDVPAERALDRTPAAIANSWTRAAQRGSQIGI